MAIALQRIADSRFGVEAISFIGRNIPPWLGHRIAGLIAGWLASRRRSKIIGAVGTNQWVSRGAGPDKEGLNQAVRLALKNTTDSLHTLPHYIHDPAARGLVERPEFGISLVNRPEGFAGMASRMEPGLRDDYPERTLFIWTQTDGTGDGEQPPRSQRM